MSDPLEPYRFVTPIEVGARDVDEQRHLNNVAIVRLFQSLRVRYIQDHVLVQRPHDYDGVVVVVADLHCHYESQGSLGEDYVGGVRICARTEKAYCFDEVIVAGSEHRVVARCRVVELFTDGRAVIPIPSEWWSTVEAAEGRVIPVSPELPVPRVRW